LAFFRTATMKRRADKAVIALCRTVAPGDEAADGYYRPLTASEKPAAAEARDGSLFDLRRDSVDAVADTIGGSITAGRAEKLARGILSRLKAAKPAG